MTHRLGIDIGSKTAKLALLDEHNELVFWEYSLHRSHVMHTLSELLRDTLWRFGDASVEVCVTGSGGMRLAEDLGLPYAQEVIASHRALQICLPEADVAIELGGEDAKILFLRGNVEERMNGSCAGGTGGFIDLMCHMLNVKASEFNALATAYTHIYPIASRCAVFAQTDVRPLINAGARKSDIAASVLQAVVTQTISGLACGRAIEGNVAFLGGPCEVYSELVQRFRHTLGLSQSQALKPKNAHLFVATGAALLAQDHAVELSLQVLKERIDALPGEQQGSIKRLPQLFTCEDDERRFRQRHADCKVPRKALFDYEGEVFIGVDAGSSMLKLAAINKEGELLYSAYENNQGDVVETMRDVLAELYRAAPHEYDGTPLTTIKRSMVCGYGEKLLKTAFCFDSSEVETVAHLRAAQEFCPDASFVLDIGGQDIKCLHLSDGQIDDIALNEACSSGCGALIQGFACSLGHTKWTFADEALKGQHPIDLGTRCTVFMTSRVRHAQKEGVSVADISAGLAYSVVKNALYKVMGLSSVASLGNRVVVQGGTFMNDAVLRAFELETGLEVTRPDIADLMGAYGAALLARDEYLSQGKNAAASSGLLNAYELATLKQTKSDLCCKACGNACNLAVSSFSFEEKLHKPQVPSEMLQFRARRINTQVERPEAAEQVCISGNRCERGAQWAARELNTQVLSWGTQRKAGANLVSYEQGLRKEFLRVRPSESSQAQAPRLGIPPVLNLYATFPYWHTLFSELGFEVLPAVDSSGDLYRAGASAVLSESVCYPAKLMHGHLRRLIDAGADFVFMPTFRRTSLPRSQGDTYADRCAVLCSYGHLAQHDTELFAPINGQVPTLLSGELASDTPTTEELRSLLVQADMFCTDERIEAAHTRASEAFQRFEQQLREQAQEELLALEQSNGIGVVLLGHSYHSDPGINHAVDCMLEELGYTVFSTNSFKQLVSEQLSGGPASRSDLPAGTWPQAEELYRVAHAVAAHPRLQLVQLHSFGCGVDALTSSVMRGIIQAAGKPYTAIKLDEMVDPASLRIRLRSLDYVLSSSPSLKSPKKTSGNLVEQAASKTSSGSGVILPVTTGHDLEQGLASLSNDLCYQMLAVGGQVLNMLKHREGSFCFALPTLCKDCRAQELERVLNYVLSHNTRVTFVTDPRTEELARLAATVAELSGKSSAAQDESIHPLCTDETKTTRIGVIGNAAMLLTPEFNDGLLARIRAEGTEPVLPSLEALFASEQPLPDLLPELYHQGIRDVIYAQSFACLRSHVDARGVLPQLKQQYPDCNITFLEYDPGASQINQLNRLKLALTLAHERKQQAARML